jgi:succinate-acetate transporter protein
MHRCDRRLWSGSGHVVFLLFGGFWFFYEMSLYHAVGEEPRSNSEEKKNDVHANLKRAK